MVATAASLGRVTLDLDELVRAGALAPRAAARLRAHALPSRGGATLVGLLYIAGALALAAGVILLEPTATTGLLLALGALGGAGLIRGAKARALDVLALGLATAGTLGMAGWFAVEFGDDLPAVAVTGFATAAALASALAFRSRFLAALVPFGIAAMLGSGTGYGHASYSVVVEEPFVTAVALAVLSIALFAAVPPLRRLARPVRADMALVAARASVVLGHVALWVGSLWGSHIGATFGRPERLDGETWSEFDARLDAFREGLVHVPEGAFTLAWLAIAVAMVPLGRRLGSAFVTNAGATFVAINLYTQFFETFEMAPGAMVAAGAATLAIAVLAANRHRFRMPAAFLN